MASFELTEQQREVVERCAESVVLVQATAGVNSNQGSGILWAQTQSSWYVYTAGHCLETGSGPTIVSVTFPGEGQYAFPATVLGTKPDIDSAVLRIHPFDWKFKPVGGAVRASETELYRLKPLIVVGFPGIFRFGTWSTLQSQSVIECKICSLPKESVVLRSGVKVSDAILIRGGITPGYSGGGAFDHAGGLVGTTCAASDAGYAVVMRRKAVADWVHQIIQEDKKTESLRQSAQIDLIDSTSSAQFASTSSAQFASTSSAQFTSASSAQSWKNSFARLISLMARQIQVSAENSALRYEMVDFELEGPLTPLMADLDFELEMPLMEDFDLGPQMPLMDPMAELALGLEMPIGPPMPSIKLETAD